MTNGEAMSVARQFCADRPWLAQPSQAYGACRECSAALADELRQAGLEARVVRLSEGRREWPGADPRWKGLSSPRDGHSPCWVHHAVLCEGTVIDVTRRQFEPDCAHPHFSALHDCLRDWGKAETLDVTRGMVTGRLSVAAEEPAAARGH